MAGAEGVVIGVGAGAPCCCFFCFCISSNLVDADMLTPPAFGGGDFRALPVAAAGAGDPGISVGEGLFGEAAAEAEEVGGGLPIGAEERAGNWKFPGVPGACGA